jgi:hypothetical protein
MSNLSVSLFRAGKLETTVTIPRKVLKTAARLIPKTAVEMLKDEGIDLDEILQLASKPDLNGQLVEVEQHAKSLKLVVTLL